MRGETYRLEPLETGDEEGCGYEWEHTCRDLGEGHWECTECGAEGWDEPAVDALDGAS